LVSLVRQLVREITQRVVHNSGCIGSPRVPARPTA
jgi:hypothetical protein